ncbi:ATP-binding protein [Shewanella donghaensis]|uniref:ATP-binding protein n=1 Tax=Shewanella donghaensis TaxID=238836 RepID=UPI001183C773|nr:ATP-binding protein [Shewanella donghaensis]
MNNLQLNLALNSMTADQVYDELEQFLSRNGLSSLQRFKLITCILEATNNVKQHCSEVADDVTVMLQYKNSHIIIDILDNSEFTSLPAPKVCPDNSTANGRGLWIMHQWMDQVQQQATVLGTHLRLSMQLG